eukprot:CAMPEP_0117558668 /NCGR_PEP_ID=MMETSP0784-20121206/52960_1 /TAXON_ID=39447 /ORGANISM="" /LENGTH=70 /DNA_ID=CAMNT_0005356015 /DNA_START=265 /DNA_END=477 /DNA_ORIENTATION=+
MRAAALAVWTPEHVPGRHLQDGREFLQEAMPPHVVIVGKPAERGTRCRNSEMRAHRWQTAQAIEDDILRQ